MSHPPCACRLRRWPRRSGWQAQTRTPTTICPIQLAGAPMSPHRTHDELRSDARHATPLQMRYPHRHLCLPPALAIEPLQQEASARRPIAARHARADDIYPASRQPGLADGKTLAAPIHSLQTPQPEPRPRLDYAASAPLPLRSLLKCTTKLSRTKGCVAQTDGSCVRGGLSSRER